MENSDNKKGVNNIRGQQNGHSPRPGNQYLQVPGIQFQQNEQRVVHKPGSITIHANDNSISSNNLDENGDEKLESHQKHRRLSRLEIQVPEVTKRWGRRRSTMVMDNLDLPSARRPSRVRKLSHVDRGQFLYQCHVDRGQYLYPCHVDIK